MTRSLASLLLAAVGLAGCTTLGTNIEASFSCTAPGGTCAPSTLIDDQALALIANDTGALQPAGPFRDDRTAQPVQSLARGAPATSVPPRSLAIRMMPRIDDIGVQHDAYLVHVNLPAAVPALARLPVSATARPVALAEKGAADTDSMLSREDIIRQAVGASPTALASSEPTARLMSAPSPTEAAPASQAQGPQVTATSGAPVRVTGPSVFSVDQ